MKHLKYILAFVLFLPMLLFLNTSKVDKEVVFIDQQIERFENTEEGREYLKLHNSLPSVRDINGYPVKRNSFTKYFEQKSKERKYKIIPPDPKLLKKLKSKKIKKSKYEKVERKTKEKKTIKKRMIKKTSSFEKVFNFFFPAAYAHDWEPGIAGVLNCRENTSVAGRFQAYFEDVSDGTGTGYDDSSEGEVRRNTACDVLKDLAHLLKINETDLIPRIYFTADFQGSSLALASASAYYGLSIGVDLNDSGSLHSLIVKREDVAVGGFHAKINTDFTVNWSYDYPNTVYGSYDFYTVMVHEVMHALGFCSTLPNIVNESNMISTFNSFNRFFHAPGTSDPLGLDNLFFSPATNFAGNDLYNLILNAPVGNPSSWYVNESNSFYRGKVNYDGADFDEPVYIYAPTYWQDGSSLSHFDWNMMYPNDSDIDYLMHPSIGTDEVRELHEHEKRALCNMGYQVLGFCEDVTPKAVSDSGAISNSSSICVNVLENDDDFSSGSPSNDHLVIYALNLLSPSVTATLYSNTGCTGSGLGSTVSTTSGIYFPNPLYGKKSISFESNPSVNSLTDVTAIYQVINTQTNRISYPAIITFNECSAPSGEYVCNGDFETIYSSSPSVPHDCDEIYQSQSVVPFWQATQGSPDRCFAPLGFSYDPVNTIFLESPSTGEPGTNVGRVVSSAPNYEEVISTKLKNKLIPNNCYKLSLDLSKLRTFSQDLLNSSVHQRNIEIKLSETLLNSSPNSNISYDSVAPFWILSQDPTADSILSSDWTTHEKYFVATDDYEYLYIGSGHFDSFIIDSNSEYYFDNVSLVERPLAECGIGKISGKVYVDSNNSNSYDDFIDSTLNGVSVSLYDSNGVYVTQELTSISPTNPFDGGNYEFLGLDPSMTYYVVLSVETDFSYINEPSSNTLLNDYNYAHQVQPQPEATEINFGVNYEPPSNLIISSTHTYRCAEDAGYIDLHVEGGSSPYTFWWSNGSTSQDNFNLTEGDYTVVVTDSLGNQAIHTVTLPPYPTPIEINGVVTHATNFPPTNGAIDITVNGVSPFSYLWGKIGDTSFSSTQEDLSNLGPGDYKVYAIDADGCAKDKTFKVRRIFPKPKPYDELKPKL